MTFIEQEKEARAYNKAFLHGREVGLSDGKAIAIDCVLEIIDKLYDTTCDRYSKVGYVESARNELRMVQQAVKALKGGEQE